MACLYDLEVCSLDDSSLKGTSTMNLIERQYYLEGFGFTPHECGLIINTFNGTLEGAEMEPSSYRSYLCQSIHDTYLEYSPQLPDAEPVIAKIRMLTKDQAKRVHGYCFGFWDAVGHLNNKQRDERAA